MQCDAVNAGIFDLPIHGKLWDVQSRSNTVGFSKSMQYSCAEILRRWFEA
jgi:hypothetical protein